HQQALGADQAFQRDGNSAQALDSQLPEHQAEARTDNSDDDPLHRVNHADIPPGEAEAAEDGDVVDAFEHGHDQDIQHAERGNHQQRAGDDVGDDRLDVEDLEEVGVGLLP